MKSAAIVIAFATGVVFAASCLVDRRSGEFTCSTDADCANLTDNRVCDTGAGFCIPLVCPSVCNGGCDLQAKKCTVSCPGSNCNKDIDCPDGFDCTITCSSPNSCNSIKCGDARSCTIMCVGTNACDNVDCGGVGDPTCNITCSGGNACGDVTCDEGACMVSCVGSGACGAVDCSDSCSCTAACPTGSCDSVTCPTGCVQGTGCGGCNTCGN